MIINLRESLNTRDRKSVNGNSKYYDLVNLYESCNLSADNKKTLAKMINNNASDKAIYSFLYECYEGKEDIKEDTVKKDGKWVNKGKEGTHGEFKTKKAADAQRKAMFANGYKGESLKESTSIYRDYNGIMGNPGATWTIKELKAYWETNHNSDPVLNEYKSMQSWLNDTIAMLHPVTNDEYGESLKESTSIKMSRDDFDRMCREGGILKGLSSRDYIEVRDSFYIGYENFDAAVNDLWAGDDGYYSRDWYEDLLKKYTNSINESLKETLGRDIISMLDKRSIEEIDGVRYAYDCFTQKDLAEVKDIVLKLLRKEFPNSTFEVYSITLTYDKLSMGVLKDDEDFNRGISIELNRFEYNYNLNEVLNKYTPQLAHELIDEMKATMSTEESLKESVNSDIVSMIKKQFPKATVKTSVRKHSDVHKSNPDTPVGKTKYVDIRITPDSASSVNSILQYCNHNIKKVLSSDERFDYYGDVPARNPRGSKEVVLSYQDYSGLSDDEYKSLLGESLKESLESEDGWSEEILDIVDPFFIEVEKVAYELRNTVRGAYRFGTTVKDLAQVFRGFSETADDIANELDDNQEHLEEDWRTGTFTRDDLTSYRAEMKKRVEGVAFSIKGMKEKHPEYYEIFDNLTAELVDILSLSYMNESLKESISIKEEPHEECIGNNCTDENDLFPEEKYFTIVVTRSDDGEDEIIDDVTKEIADKYIDDLKRDNDEFFSHAKVLDHNGEVVNSWEYLEEAAKSKKSSSIKDRLKKLIPDLDI